MPFDGTQLQPYEIAELLHRLGWRDLDLVEMTATILAESWGYVRAFNDNVDEKGRVKSRDVGLAQINIPARYIGTKRETALYEPVKNLTAARKLFDTRMTLTKRRRFQPWYGYTLGWATFPGWWYATKDPPRQWKPSGQYLHKAIAGVANFHAKRYGVEPYPLVYLSPRPPVPATKPKPGEGRPIPNKGRGHA